MNAFNQNIQNDKSFDTLSGDSLTVRQLNYTSLNPPISGALTDPLPLTTLNVKNIGSNAQANINVLAPIDLNNNTLANVSNMGVGTSNPNYQVEIRNTTGNTGFSIDNGTKNTQFGLAFGNGAFSSDAAANDTVLRSGTGQKLLLQSGGTNSHIAILSNGNVGINTVTAPDKLTVNGTIQTTGLKTNSIATTGGLIQFNGSANFNGGNISEVFNFSGIGSSAINVNSSLNLNSNNISGINNLTANGTVFANAWQSSGSSISVNSPLNMGNNDITNGGTLTTTNLNVTNINPTNLLNFLYMPANTIDIFPKIMSAGSSIAVNGAVNLVFFFPLVNMTVSSMGHVFQTAATDTGGTTVRRYGLYQPTTTNGNTLNLVARTAVTNTIGTSQGYTGISFSTAGGFPATVNLLANTQYCFASIFYNTGGTFNGPTPMGCQNSALISDVSHRSFYRLATQTDLPTAITLTTTERNSFGYFGRLQ